MGGRPAAPNAIFGSWKAAVRTVDKTKTPALVTITPDADPAKNNWNLPGGDPVPAGLAQRRLRRGGALERAAGARAIRTASRCWCTTAIRTRPAATRARRACSSARRGAARTRRVAAAPARAARAARPTCPDGRPGLRPGRPPRRAAAPPAPFAPTAAVSPSARLSRHAPRRRGLPGFGGLLISAAATKLLTFRRSLGLTFRERRAWWSAKRSSAIYSDATLLTSPRSAFGCWGGTTSWTISSRRSSSRRTAGSTSCAAPMRRRPGWPASRCAGHPAPAARRLRSFFSLEALPPDARLIDDGATPEEKAEIASTYRMVERIPVRQRVVWVLKHVEGETLDAIAEICGFRRPRCSGGCAPPNEPYRLQEARRSAWTTHVISASIGCWRGSSRAGTRSAHGASLRRDHGAHPAATAPRRCAAARSRGDPIAALALRAQPRSSLSGPVPYGRGPVDGAERRHVQAERLHDRDVEVGERLVGAARGADRA